MSFFKNLLGEIKDNGKLLTIFIASQLPGITSVPGISTALHTAIADRTVPSYIDLSVQVLMYVAAGLRAKKLIVNAAEK